MKVVKYEVEVKVEGKDKALTIKRKYRHMAYARDFVRGLVKGECKWTTEGNVIKAECSSNEGTKYLVSITKVRLQRPEKEDKEKQGKVQEQGKS
jgi:hypothetical protein